MKKYKITNDYYFFKELEKCLYNRGCSLDKRKGKLLSLLNKLYSVKDGNEGNRQAFISIVRGFIERYELKIKKQFSVINNRQR